MGASRIWLECAVQSLDQIEQECFDQLPRVNLHLYLARSQTQASQTRRPYRQQTDQGLFEKPGGESEREEEVVTSLPGTNSREGSVELSYAVVEPLQVPTI